MDRIHSPEDLRALDGSELPLLCDELRGFLVTQVSRTGGHLASNLGVVELTVAIHRVFDTARDRLVFDVGHQCYVHKILTGRADRFPTLRQLGGISGFPKPCESAHDAFIAGHASNSVSVALGMARARTMLHEDYSVLALIGDGALTGGLAYEGLNNAGASGEPLIVILNDNGMSIDRNVGAMSEHLSRLRTKPEYFAFKKAYHNALSGTAAGRALYRFNHSLKTGLKKAMLPNATMFEDMGFAYLGPVDGHDLAQLTTTLEWAREMKRPVLVHVRTQKGHGYAPAEREPWKFHGVGPFDAATGAVTQCAFGGGIFNASWQDIVSGLGWGLGYFGMPHILVRFMSIEKPSMIKKSSIVAIIWVVISLFSAVMIAYFGRMIMGEELLTHGNQKLVFIAMSRKFFPAGICGLLLAAIIAASISTADSQLLVASSSFTADLYKPFFRKGASEKETLLVGRVLVLVLSLIAFAIANSKGSGAQAIMDMVENAWGAFGSSFGPTILLSLFWKRFNYKGAVAGVVSGFVVDLGWLLSGLTASTGVYEIVPGFIVSFLAAYLVARFTEAPNAEAVAIFEEATKPDAD